MARPGYAGEQVFRIVPRPGSPPNVEISMGGDSGSVWVDEASGKAVGLHFAGEVGDDPEFALAHDINPVMARLGFIFPAQLPAPEPPAEPEPPTATTPPPTHSWWQRFVNWLRGLFG